MFDSDVEFNDNNEYVDLENFYLLHNLEVNRLAGKKNLSSIAI